MIKIAIVCVLVLGLTLGQCDKGCLKCNSKNECIFCDISNNYYLSGTKCLTSTLTNCLKLVSSGGCGVCGPNYYLDSATKKCVAVDTAKAVTNCANYGAGQVCVKCSKGFFISSSKCTAITKTVDNCDTYSADGTCAACSSGFMYNAARNACVANPTTANCFAYSFLDCKSCASGYIANQNLYFLGYHTNSGNLWADIQTFTTGNPIDWVNTARCQKYQDVNCLVGSAFNVCTTCKPGFFLTSANACRAFPKAIIEGCSVYTSLTTCGGCQNGYYLQSNTQCTLIIGTALISDCTSYSTTAATVQCAQCSSSKFLSGNTCTPNNRTDSLNIANCKTTTITADTCATCNDNFVATTDGKKCLAAISNCNTYVSSSSSSTSLSCSACKSTFYLNTDANSVTTCIAGAIVGCLTYSSSTVCTACDTTGYFLAGSTCTKHVTVANCLTYSGSQFNQCVSCAVGYYPFNYNTVCGSITAIANCATYSATTTCSSCVSGYFLNNNACSSISASFPNCAAAGSAATQCARCSDTFAFKNVAGDLNCASNHKYILDQCDAPASGVAITFANISTADTASCIGCKENSYPRNIGLTYACVDNLLLTTKGVTGAAVITGCAKYAPISSAVTCVQCATGFVNIPASGARTCVATCAAATNTVVADNLDGQYNLCALQSDTTYGLANCGASVKYWNPAGSGAWAYSCVKSGAQQLVADFTAIADNGSLWRDVDGSTVPRPAGAFFYAGFPTGFGGASPTNNHDNQSVTAQNCEVYYLKSSALACARCAWGYTTTFVTTGAVNKTRCSNIANCDKTVSYSGFNNKLNIFLSCHACTGGNFVLVSANIATDVANIVLSDLTSDIAAIQCVTPTAAAATASVPQTVANCQVYGWFTNGAGAAAPTNARGCVACQPGYTFTPSAANSNFGTCAAVTNCDTTKNFMVNRCSVCTQVNASAAVEWKAFTDYTGTSCVLVKSDNCLFVTGAADANNKYNCGTCKPGFVLNQDNQCEKVTLPSCNDASGATNVLPIPNLSSEAQGATYYALKYLSTAGSISGCNTCATGFTGVLIPANEVQCVVSPYVQTNVFATGTKYVPDCAKYSKTLNTGNTIAAVCRVCKNNKIPTADGTQCVANIQNCVNADNATITRCSTCASTHVQINGVCTLKNIVNCATYNEAANVASLLCASCNAGFVLATNQLSCYAGNVAGCSSYSTDLPWVCTACLANFNLVSTANSRTYCIKVDSGSNCLALDVTASGLQGGIYKCTSCSVSNAASFFPASYATGDNTKVQSVCLSLNLVDKCTAYDSASSTLATNSLLCTACSTGFWVDQTKNVCVARANNPSSCTTFYAAADKCSVCAVGSFKTTDETDCVSNPNGILRCATYSNDTVCTGCNAPAYLSNNTCPLSTVITNCATYTANYTCSACAGGFFLTNATACTTAQATNCLTYSAINACATCAAGKGLKTDSNGNTNCVDHGIANCAVATTTFPFTCTACNAGYYLAADGTCALPTTITKCVTYDSASTCTRCDTTAVLAVDRKTCNDTAFAGVPDSNCADNQQVGSAICSKCSPGSFFSNGTCTSCSNNTFASGCYSCDPVNQTNCFACRSGYYQTANGACVSITPAINNTNNTNNTTSAVIMRMFGLLVALLALLF